MAQLSIVQIVGALTSQPSAGVQATPCWTEALNLYAQYTYAGFKSAGPSVASTLMAPYVVPFEGIANGRLFAMRVSSGSVQVLVTSDAGTDQAYDCDDMLILSAVGQGREFAIGQARRHGRRALRARRRPQLAPGGAAPLTAPRAGSGVYLLRDTTTLAPEDPMSTRGTLNAADPNRTDAALNSIRFGSVLNMLLAAAAYTETGVSPSSSVATLANQPESLLDVFATAGTTTGRKTVLKGPISGVGALVPTTGQCVWDGNKKVLFASADAVSAAKFA